MFYSLRCSFKQDQKESILLMLLHNLFLLLYIQTRDSFTFFCLHSWKTKKWRLEKKRHINIILFSSLQKCEQLHDSLEIRNRNREAEIQSEKVGLMKCLSKSDQVTVVLMPWEEKFGERIENRTQSVTIIMILLLLVLNITT